MSGSPTDESELSMRFTELGMDIRKLTKAVERLHGEDPERAQLDRLLSATNAIHNAFNLCWAAYTHKEVEQSPYTQRKPAKKLKGKVKTR